MAQFPRHHDPLAEHQRRQLGIRRSAVHAGYMSDVSLQGRRLEERVQPDHRGFVPTAVGDCNTIGRGDEHGGMGDAAHITEGLQTCDIRGSTPL